MLVHYWKPLSVLHNTKYAERVIIYGNPLMVLVKREYRTLIEKCVRLQHLQKSSEKMCREIFRTWISRRWKTPIFSRHGISGDININADTPNEMMSRVFHLLVYVWYVPVEIFHSESLLEVFSFEHITVGYWYVSPRSLAALAHFGSTSRVKIVQMNHYYQISRWRYIDSEPLR